MDPRSCHGFDRRPSYSSSSTSFSSSVSASDITGPTQSNVSGQSSAHMSVNKSTLASQSQDSLTKSHSGKRDSQYLHKPIILPPIRSELASEFVPRKRAKLACRRCRRRKIRCLGASESIDGQCMACRRAKEERCIFTPVTNESHELLPVQAVYAKQTPPPNVGLYGAFGQPLQKPILPRNADYASTTNHFQNYQQQQAMKPSLLHGATQAGGYHHHANDQSNSRLTASQMQSYPSMIVDQSTMNQANWVQTSCQPGWLHEYHPAPAVLPPQLSGNYFL